MKQIASKLRDVLKNLGLTNARLQVARRRWLANHNRAVRNHKLQVENQKQADRARKGGHRVLATRLDRKALRCAHRASKAHHRALYWVQRVKDLTAQQQGFERDAAALKKAAAKWRKEHGVTVRGNRVLGGTAPQRLRAAMDQSAANCASGRRNNFYSQSGSYDAKHCLTGPAYGHRDDCSSWFASVYWSAGLKDPNGLNFSGGYTGTLGSRGRSISRAQAAKTPGAAVLFGSYPYEHVEMARGDGGEDTVGHGSAPVDRGSFSLLPGPVSFRKYL